MVWAMHLPEEQKAKITNINRNEEKPRGYPLVVCLPTQPYNKQSYRLIGDKNATRL